MVNSTTVLERITVNRYNMVFELYSFDRIGSQEV